MSVENHLKLTGQNYDIGNISKAFDLFLDLVEQARISPSIYKPVDNHFTTHTASMWNDVTDFEGNVLLKKIYKLEDLVEGLNEVFEICGIEKRIEKNIIKVNQNQNRIGFHPTKSQKLKVEMLFENDFDLFESLK
jgi:hypothetical protein